MQNEAIEKRLRFIWITLLRIRFRRRGWKPGEDHSAVGGLQPLDSTANRSRFYGMIKNSENGRRYECAQATITDLIRLAWKDHRIASLENTGSRRIMEKCECV